MRPSRRSCCWRRWRTSRRGERDGIAVGRGPLRVGRGSHHGVERIRSWWGACPITVGKGSRRGGERAPRRWGRDHVVVGSVPHDGGEGITSWWGACPTTVGKGSCRGGGRAGAPLKRSACGKGWVLRQTMVSIAVFLA